MINQVQAEEDHRLWNNSCKPRNDICVWNFVCFWDFCRICITAWISKSVCIWGTFSISEFRRKKVDKQYCVYKTFNSTLFPNFKNNKKITTRNNKKTHGNFDVWHFVLLAGTIFTYQLLLQIWVLLSLFIVVGQWESYDKIKAGDLNTFFGFDASIKKLNNLLHFWDELLSLDYYYNCNVQDDERFLHFHCCFYIFI